MSDFSFWLFCWAPNLRLEVTLSAPKGTFSLPSHFHHFCEKSSLNLTTCFFLRLTCFPLRNFFFLKVFFLWSFFQQFYYHILRRVIHFLSPVWCYLAFLVFLSRRICLNHMLIVDEMLVMSTSLKCSPDTSQLTLTICGLTAYWSCLISPHIPRTCSRINHWRHTALLLRSLLRAISLRHSSFPFLLSAPLLVLGGAEGF